MPNEQKTLTGEERRAAWQRAKDETEALCETSKRLAAITAHLHELTMRAMDGFRTGPGMFSIVPLVEFDQAIRMSRDGIDTFETDARSVIANLSAALNGR